MSILAYLLVDVVVDPLFALLPLAGHTRHLLLQPLVALQQGVVHVLIVRVVRGGAVSGKNAKKVTYYYY